MEISLYKDEILARDDEAGHADLEAEVIAKLGSDGWELVTIDAPSFIGPSRYIFKKPALSQAS